MARPSGCWQPAAAIAAAPASKNRPPKTVLANIAWFPGLRRFPLSPDRSGPSWPSAPKSLPSALHGFGKSSRRGKGKPPTPQPSSHGFAGNSDRILHRNAAGRGRHLVVESEAPQDTPSEGGSTGLEHIAATAATTTATLARTWSTRSTAAPGTAATASGFRRDSRARE